MDSTLPESKQHEPENARTEKPNDHPKALGKTPDGIIFVIPKTNDMVSQLLDPREPHSFFDALVIATIALLIAALYATPQSARQLVSTVMFLFWRGCYNIGIGWLLYQQSNSRLLISWAKTSQIFNSSPKGLSPSLLQTLIRKELEKKISSKDYRFDHAPIEYNTWLVFRRLVDMVLMCDFASYLIFAFTHSVRPISQSLLGTASLYLIGLSLIAFNLWVKCDAHRVVKDYAWYWGDFFYLNTNCELTFDGVFEIFPHPMYSVGYAGYYGISLISANYKVLLISIIAHASQFAFLSYVETPHIQKTYPSPVDSLYVDRNINVWELA